MRQSKSVPPCPHVPVQCLPCRPVLRSDRSTRDGRQPPRSAASRSASAVSLAARSSTVRLLAIFEVTMVRTHGSARAPPSAMRYCWRRSRTLPLTGPVTRARKRPFSLRNEIPTTTFTAQREYQRRAGDLSPADQPLQRVDRQSKLLLSAYFDRDGFAVAMQVSSLGHDMKRIERSLRMDKPHTGQCRRGSRLRHTGAAWLRQVPLCVTAVVE